MLEVKKLDYEIRWNGHICLSLNLVINSTFNVHYDTVKYEYSTFIFIFAKTCMSIAILTCFMAVHFSWHLAVYFNIFDYNNNVNSGEMIVSIPYRAGFGGELENFPTCELKWNRYITKHANNTEISMNNLDDEVTLNVSASANTR